MKIVDLKQGSEEWLEWRSNGIGASEIGVIMGSDPYKNPWKLWHEKCGYGEPIEITAPMLHGVKNEPKARHWLNTINRWETVPLCIEDSQEPFMKASLDGYDFKKKLLVEIKCPVSQKKIDDCRTKGQIPLHWTHQVQWQMMIAGLDESWVAVWDYNEEICMQVKVLASKPLHEEMRAKASEFWKSVRNGLPPTQGKGDYIRKEDEELEEKLRHAMEAKKREKIASLEYKAIKDEIEEATEGLNTLVGDFKVVWQDGRSFLDEGAMKLDGIDTDKYRRKSDKGPSCRIVGPK